MDHIFFVFLFDFEGGRGDQDEAIVYRWLTLGELTGEVPRALRVTLILVHSSSRYKQINLCKYLCYSFASKVHYF